MQGEGEVLINSVLDALSSSQPIPEIPGLWTPGFSPSFQGFCEDINKLESPILSGALDLRENEGLLWELSRGCPFACDFCFESKGSGKVRYFSLERVRKELEKIGKSGIRQVFILDPTFNVNKKRVMTILEWIRELTPETYYYFEIRTEFLDEESAFAFSSIPCTLQIGLQSSDPAVLKEINRDFDPDMFKEKVSLLGDAGVPFGLDLIYGLPGDSLEGFKNSLNYALSLEPNHLDLFPLSVLPGTALYDRRETLKMTCDPHDPYQVRKTENFSVDDIERARLLSEHCDSLYNKSRGISWFNRVCYDLNLNPVQILEEWSEFMKNKDHSDKRRVLLFLKSLYRIHNSEGLFPVISDLFNYLDLLEELEQLEGSNPPDTHISINDETVLSLHSSVRFIDFNIPPDLILEGFPGGSAELMEVSGRYPALLWVRNHGVCMDILDTEERNILLSLKKKVQKISDLRESQSLSDLNEFLMNGILEGYIQI
jgi:hypothetical protein